MEIVHTAGLKDLVRGIGADPHVARERHTLKRVVVKKRRSALVEVRWQRNSYRIERYDAQIRDSRRGHVIERHRHATRCRETSRQGHGYVGSNRRVVDRRRRSRGQGEVKFRDVPDRRNVGRRWVRKWFYLRLLHHYGQQVVARRRRRASGIEENHIRDLNRNGKWHKIA